MPNTDKVNGSTTKYRLTKNGRKIFFNPDKCGSYAGANQHNAFQEPQCAACAKAKARYMNKYRATRVKQGNPLDRKWEMARRRALTRLGQRYPEELYKLTMAEYTQDKKLPCEECLHTHDQHQTRKGTCRVPACQCKEYIG